MKRLACVVPGCRHTRSNRKGEPPIIEGMEWVCGEHWRAVPKRLRRALFLIRRRSKRKPLLKSIEARWWRRCRDAAIERAVGIG